MRSKPRGGPRRGLSTQAIHLADSEGVPGGPVAPPIIQSSTFLFGGYPDEPTEHRYTRYGNNPTQVLVAEKVAALDGMEAGLVLASGMAATSMTLLALLRTGDHLLASKYLYGATRRRFSSLSFRPTRHSASSIPDPWRSWPKRRGSPLWWTLPLRRP